MGKALQVITGSISDPSTTIKQLVPNSGDSFTVQNASAGSSVLLLNAWAYSATAGVLRIRSPKMHDFVQNMRLQYVASQPERLLPDSALQALFPQDLLTVEMSGDAAAVDLASLLVYYSDLPGANANLQTWSAIAPLIAELTTIEVDVTSSATSCQYGNTVAFNADYDTLKRGETYAILGYECSTNGGTLGFSGQFSSNNRIGAPLSNDTRRTRQYFIDLANISGQPTIPVFGAADVASIYLDVAAQAVSTAFNIGINLARLKSALQ